MKKESYTTTQIGEICQVTVTTVIVWIDKGMLTAFKTIGGHRRVWKSVLFEFLKKNDLPIPDELEYLGIKKVLIIDDDEKVVKSLKKIIQHKNNRCKIYTALDGFQAGHYVNKLRPDCIILDVKLPGIDGIEVCKFIRKSELKPIIIAISGYATKEEEKKILSAGADYFLNKPINMDEMMDILRKLCKLNIAEAV